MSRIPVMGTDTEPNRKHLNFGSGMRYRNSYKNRFGIGIGILPIPNWKYRNPVFRCCHPFQECPRTAYNTYRLKANHNGPQPTSYRAL